MEGENANGVGKTSLLLQYGMWTTSVAISIWTLFNTSVVYDKVWLDHALKTTEATEWQTISTIMKVMYQLRLLILYIGACVCCSTTSIAIFKVFTNKFIQEEEKQTKENLLDVNMI